jgi:prepilin-type N-terminal cleavage/methylation domain-containing protein
VRSQRGFTLVELMVVVAILAILSMLLISVASRPYGANAATVSDQLVSEFSFARMRAIATRKVHRVTLYTSSTGEQVAQLEAADTTGMNTTSTTTWKTVEYKRIPTTAQIWSASAGATTSTGASPAQDAGLPYEVYFKPDGAATATTVYLKDRSGTPHYYRVLVYHVTGSSYARETW